MSLTAESWPIAAAMINFPGVTPHGVPLVEAGSEFWIDALDAVAAAGFSDLDPTDSWLPIAELSPTRRAEFLQLARERGLSIPAISTARRSVLDPARGADHLRYSHKVIDVAAEIGASVVSFGLMRELTKAQRGVQWFWTLDGASDRFDDDDYAHAAGLFRELGDHAASNGIVIALEMYEETLLGSAASALRLLDLVDHPQVGLNPDLGNIVRQHRSIEPISELIERVVPRTTYWHVKNYLRLEDPTRGIVLSAPAPMATGVIDYRRALSIAFEAGFRGAFCVEHYGGDGLSVSAENREYVRSLLRSPDIARKAGIAEGNASS